MESCTYFSTDNHISLGPVCLLTNDDGIESKYLLETARRLQNNYKVIVCAPKYPQSAMSRSYPSTPSGIIEKVTLSNNSNEIGYSITGSPAQVVSYAILELTGNLPELTVSGINNGENLGSTLTSSGTIGAAMEAASYGIKSIAASIEYRAPITSIEQASQHLLEICTKVNQNWHHEIALLNVNFPNDISRITPVEITASSVQPYFYFKPPDRGRDLSRPWDLQTYTYIDDDTLEQNSDIACVKRRRHTSITPISHTLYNPLDKAVTKWN